MSRMGFSSVGFDSLECPQHGKTNSALSVNRVILGQARWETRQMYCLECAADLILESLDPMKETSA